MARRSLLLGLAALVSSLAILEIGVRIVTALDRNYLDELAPRRPSNGELTLADLIRTHPDDQIAYQLRPGVQGRFVGASVSINSMGMRDEERIWKKPPGVFRIVGLGDSQMFGWGVAHEQTFLAVLEKLLNQRLAPAVFEVWNFAVPGYNTVQEVASFAAKAEALEPDLVIIGYVDNDMDLPNFLAERPDVWSLGRSYLGELLHRRLAILRGERLMPLGLVAVDENPRSRRYRFAPDRVPERYRVLDGVPNMLAAFDRLAALAAERGVRPVLLFNLDDYSRRLAGRASDLRPKRLRRLAKRCAEKGYLVVDPQDRITAFLRQNQLDSHALWISSSDAHGSRLRHSLVAEEIFAELRSARALPGKGVRQPFGRTPHSD